MARLPPPRRASCPPRTSWPCWRATRATSRALLRPAAEQGLPEAECELGVFQSTGWACEQDYERALELFLRAAAQGSAVAHLNAAEAAMVVASNKHGRADLVGHSAVPRAMQLARRAARLGASMVALELVQRVDASYRTLCGFCGEKHKPLQKCARCQTHYYCSKECQLAHWQQGHKTDCVDVTKQST